MHLGFTRRRRWLAGSLGALLLAGLIFAQDGSAPAAGHIGLKLLFISPDRATELKLDKAQGAEVIAVRPGGPAAKAGFRPGDVLLAYNGQQLVNEAQVKQLVSQTTAGSKVKVEYWRGGKRFTTTVIPEAAAPTEDRPVVDESLLRAMDIPRPMVVWENVALGIECEPLDEQLAAFFGVPGGILIRHVQRGYVGDRAGLQAGDVIQSVDTQIVAVPKDLISYLRTRNEPGKALVIRVMRDHKPHTMAISLQ